MTIHAPIHDYATARRTMVEGQLRPQGVTDVGVLDAMGSVPREQFVPSRLKASAYSDRSIDLGDGRFLPAAPVLGQLLTQMAPVSGQSALVLGSATGYSAAVLRHIG